MIIKLNRKFYSRGCVQEGLAAYNALCEGTVQEDEESIIITIRPKPGIDEKQLSGEIINYCLACMKKNGIQRLP
jgi:hypothetical protein